MDFATTLPDWAQKTLWATAIFIVSLLAARLLRAMLHSKLLPDPLEENPAIDLLESLLYWGVLTLGALTALNQFFDVTAYLAGLGVAGFALGFALQDIMQNLAAGILLLVQRPFTVGEMVEISGQGGTVREIDLRATELETWDGRIILIPNAKVLGEIIINYTRAQRRRVEVPIGIGYGDDPEKARRALLEGLRGLPGLVDSPAPYVRFQNFGESSVDLTLYFWIDTSQTDVFAARDAAVVRARAALEAAGVDIPYPIRTVYLEGQADQ